MEQVYFLLNTNTDDINTLKKSNEQVSTLLHESIEKQKELESKLLDCSTYLIKTLQILERVVPLLTPGGEPAPDTTDFSLPSAISALERLRDS